MAEAGIGNGPAQACPRAVGQVMILNSEGLLQRFFKYR